MNSIIFRGDYHTIPNYIVPLPTQAVAMIGDLMTYRAGGQIYILSHYSDPMRYISENTLNGALKRMGYKDKLTGHGIRATISTALNELGYQKEWIDAQLSHFDKDQIRATYNHALYVKQRRKMMQNWEDLLDKWRQQSQNHQ